MLDGQIVIVTGAGDGIGRAIAHTLAKSGAKVAVADINPEAGQAVVRDIQAAGAPEPLAVTADVGDVAAIDRMVSEVVAHYGRLDGIVNNAGVTRRASIMEITEEDWDWMNRVNAKGVFFCLQRAAQQMMEQGRGSE